MAVIAWGQAQYMRGIISHTGLVKGPPKLAVVRPEFGQHRKPRVVVIPLTATVMAVLNRMETRIAAERAAVSIAVSTAAVRVMAVTPRAQVEIVKAKVGIEVEVLPP